MRTQDNGLTSEGREQEQRCTPLEIYEYDELPTPFRHQVIFIWDDAMGLYHVRRNPYPNIRRESDPTYNNPFWDSVVDLLSRDYGIPRLGLSERDSKELCKQYLLRQNAVKALRLIELTFSMMEKELKDMSRMKRQQYRIRLTPDQAIHELNRRFQEHRIGYQYEGGQLIKIESEYFHTEVTMPALQLLATKGFEGPAKEFLDAHEHFLQGRYDSAITEASNSLESTIKSIFKARKITYNKNWAAKDLIQKSFEIGLIPRYLESYFENLRNVLQGLPTVRSKESAHGVGAVPVDLPPFLAAYAINSAAANILFLVSAHKSKAGH
jgi:hypothetical protein